jgi:hypothetical protein
MTLLWFFYVSTELHRFFCMRITNQPTESAYSPFFLAPSSAYDTLLARDSDKQECKAKTWHDKAHSATRKKIANAIAYLSQARLRTSGL